MNIRTSIAVTWLEDIDCRIGYIFDLTGIQKRSLMQSPYRSIFRRLSYLPESIIHDILSCLDTEMPSRLVSCPNTLIVSVSMAKTMKKHRPPSKILSFMYSSITSPPSMSVDSGFFTLT
ncbi:hypothetical protein Ddye_014867 [Dipteronia dyeriana]|uniref:F-box domain-containing protein n=1 Tax=Dipteronia dyeriana TaxID=168575 RepID=A0AAD9U4H8_9ROSI|nr:hypothetical protein Ddye_014867 [Dipteronia dyeriana]